MLVRACGAAGCLARFRGAESRRGAWFSLACPANESRLASVQRRQPPLPATHQDAPTLAAGLRAFGAAFLQAWSDLLLSTYLSLATAVGFYFVCLGFARGGGVGAAPAERDGGGGGPAPAWQGGGGSRRRRGAVVGPIAKLKTGGLSTQVRGAGHPLGTMDAFAFSTPAPSAGLRRRPRPALDAPRAVPCLSVHPPPQLLVAAVHAGAHLSLAITLLLLIELAVEMCIRWV
jgi:hypothetical protein